MFTELTPSQAWKMLQEFPDVILLDVCSKVEFDVVGHPVDVVHVPIQETPDWQTDPDFAHKVIERRGESSRDVIILTICRSDKRSILARQGKKHKANIAEGFEGDLDEKRHRSSINRWRYCGLPWE